MRWHEGCAMAAVLLLPWVPKFMVELDLATLPEMPVEKGFL